jgi:hypothetical protein
MTTIIKSIINTISSLFKKSSTDTIVTNETNMIQIKPDEKNTYLDHDSEIVSYKQPIGDDNV